MMGVHNSTTPKKWLKCLHVLPDAKHAVAMSSSKPKDPDRMINYETANEVKASFNEVYQSPTPHAYFTEMNRLEYAIGQEARPYFQSVMALMRRQLGPDIPIRMLDLGCSYGVGSALVKYGFSFSEIAEFFENEANRDYCDCVTDTKSWLAENEAAKPLACIGADASSEAIKFASAAGLIDDGIAQDLETDQKLPAQECSLIQHCNLLTSTGAIGYVGEKTVSAILTHLGKACPPGRGPYTAVTILRMFQVEQIRKTFEKFGYRFELAPGVRLRQRRFQDEKEQKETIRLLAERGISTAGWEDTGYLYADLYVAAPAAELELMLKQVEQTRQRLEKESKASEGKEVSAVA